MNKYLLMAVRLIVLGLVGVVILYPLYQTIILSLRPAADIYEYIAQVNNRTLRFISGYFFPQSFSPEQYIQAFTDTFRRAYFVTVIYTLGITALYFPVAIVLGFVFAKVRFFGRDVLFFLFIAAMVLPFHVTLVPMHQILHRLTLFDTPWAVILPAVFSPLGVFLVRQFFRQVPDELLEAASLDGAGVFRTIVFIMMPISRYGLAIFFLLTITIQWSAIEPTLAFIRSDEWLPISLLLREMMESSPEHIFAPSVLYMLPMLLLFYATSKGRKSL
jgi:multiple sugar transport system permease protein